MNMHEQDEFLKKISKVKTMLLFLFSRERYEALAIKHDKAQGIVKSPELYVAYEQGKYDEHTKELVAYRTSALRKSLLESGSVVAIVLVGTGVAGLLLSYFTKPCPNWLGAVLQAAGVAIILWATIWELGWDIRSYGGSTLSERVHQWIFRTSYSIGSGLFFFAYAWAIQW